MNVIASRGDSVYLVDIGEANGIVVRLDPEAPEVFPPFNLQSILARGYWEEYSDGPELEKYILELVAEEKPKSDTSDDTT